MNRLLLATAVALASAATASAAVGVDTIPAPAPIKMVSPPQGLINLAGDHSPLGVSEISYYISSPSINKNCTEKAKIFIDGSDVPAEEVGVENAYVDAMGSPIASFKFNKLYVDPGLYRVTVPEGFFYSGDTPVPAAVLNYEIYVAYTVSPIPGNIESASVFTLEFPDYQELKYKGGIIFYPDGDDTTYETKVEIIEQEGVYPNKMKITLLDDKGEPVTISKTALYTLYVPEASIEYTAYGPSYATNPEDKVTESTPELRLRYCIPSTAKPEISPAEGVVEGFRSFTVTVPSEFKISVVDDKMQSYIYPVLPNGTLSHNPLYKLTANTLYDAAKNQVTFNVLNASGNPVRTPVNPGPGRYAFKMNRCIYGNVNNGAELVAIAEFDYFYTIEAPKFELTADPADKATVSKLENVSLYFAWADNMDINSAVTERPAIFTSNGNVDGVSVDITMEGGVSPLADGVIDQYTPKAVLTVSPAVNTPGDYTITIPAEFFKNGTELSPTYVLSYTISTSGVENVEVATDVTVYTISGVKVLDKANPEAISTLPAGLYIVNGKKVMINK